MELPLQSRRHLRLPQTLVSRVVPPSPPPHGGLNAPLRPPNTSDVREIMVQDNADVAYQKALRSVLRLGGSVTQANPQARVISAVVKVAIIAGILRGSSMQ